MHRDFKVTKEYNRVFFRPSRAAKESEKDTEKYLSKAMGRIEGQCYKWSSPNNRGVPDRICIFPDGHIVFVETKSEGEKLSRIQLIVHKELEPLVKKVYVIDTVAGVDDFIKIENS